MNNLICNSIIFSFLCFQIQAEVISLQSPNKIIRNHAYSRNNGGKKFIGQAIRTERYPMLQWTNLKDDNDRVYELYDFEEDPLETKKYAELKPDVLKDMIAILKTHPTPKPVLRR